HSAVLTLHRVPGDVSLALVVQALAGQEQRRFGGGADAGAEIDLSAASERTVLLDYTGARLAVESLVGDVVDPGVVTALLYESVGRDAAGRTTYDPPPEESNRMLHTVAQVDTEISSKLLRHLRSADATLMARLDLAHG